MKNNIIKFINLLSFALFITIMLVIGVFAKSSVSVSETESSARQDISNIKSTCQHCVYFNFNDETHTIDGLNSKC